MNDTTWTCDRCNEVCALCEVVLVEKIYGVGEVVCKPCLADEYREEMNRK